MTRLFRSKSCGLVGLTEFNPAPPPSPFYHQNDDDDDEEEEEGEEEEEEEEDEDEEEEEGYDGVSRNPPLIVNNGSERGGRNGSEEDNSSSSSSNSCCSHNNNNNSNSSNQFAILDILVTALRKSLVTCSMEREDVSAMDISWPTEVRHVSHVTFDRFNGFLGLPTELEPEVPRKVPSASVSVFGVSAKSMQCSYDARGNSVPTILLMMQNRLYVEGGLKAEGIFRITAENSQEEYVRDQLNKGVVPRGIDVHCLAGLIKAWFRELPSGVLDTLTPEQVMHCNTEDDCTQLVKSLPTTEASLLDWAINLMADVVEHEQYNKMNARNVAMVFAPNMTQMADPLTALIHAVQVMNLLKTLIMKTLGEREEFSAMVRLQSGCSDSPSKKSSVPCESNLNSSDSCKISTDASAVGIPTTAKFLRSSTMHCLESTNEEIYWSFQKKSDGEEEFQSVSGSSPGLSETSAFNKGCKSPYDNGDWLSLRKGVKRLCSHPVFQLGKPVKKTSLLGL